MAKGEDREMTLKLTKVRGQADHYVLSYDNGTKVAAWRVDGNDVDTEILQDVVDTVHPALPPTRPMYQAGTQLNPQFVQPMLPLPGGWNEVQVTHNTGAEAADKAARDEELRLRNMGGALRTGINLAAEDIPVFDSGELPDVNWSA
jgi:hypothetical protein